MLVSLSMREILSQGLTMLIGLDVDGWAVVILRPAGDPDIDNRTVSRVIPRSGKQAVMHEKTRIMVRQNDINDDT